jgi:hypothetical protein
MSITSRMAAVLRARKAKEDVAKAALSRANAAAADARASRQGREDALSTWRGAHAGAPGAFLASVAAGRAMAAALQTATEFTEAAELAALVQRDELRDRAVDRRGVERLTERVADEQRLAELEQLQRVVDDLTVGRAHARPDGAGR